jgi:anti-sigma28 factor (negative regulator of flagellin synthesis)
VPIDKAELVDEARMERIGNLKKVISDGSYKVSAVDVACKIVPPPTDP